MADDVGLLIPSEFNRDAILDRLDSVLDPELDESILQLGFVKAIRVENAGLTVDLQLPTHWCAVNFAYIMAFDARRELMRVDGVDRVTIVLLDHFASNEIESAVNAGQTFVEAFPEEAADNLEQIRDLFLRKGYIKRQELVLRQLMDAGLSLEDISALQIQDIYFNNGSYGVARGESQGEYVGPAEAAQRYLERRAYLGLGCSPTGPLITGLSDDAIPADELKAYLLRSRTVRVSMEANGSFCSAVLASRDSAKA
jgi:metal-sulfur cluster biosynthetic enzyme